LPVDGTYERIFTGSRYNRTDKWGIHIIDYVNTQMINYHFDRKKVIHAKGGLKRWYGSYLGLKNLVFPAILYPRHDFQFFITPHNEKPFLKSVYEDAWAAEPEVLGQSCTTFRENVSLSGYFIRYWQLASNKFYPRDVMKTRHTLFLGGKNIAEVKRWLE